jgi:hypothetical protein
MANSTSSALVIHHSNHVHGHQAPPEVVVDALPYYDSGYDEPGAREAVSKFFCLFQLLNFSHFRLLV